MSRAILRPLEIVCHRGANRLAPENTYAAAQICVDWGAGTVEIDVNTSADGVMYLFHGPELERTTDGVGRIANTPSSVIDGLDAGAHFGPQYAGTRMPRLEPFLQWARDKCDLFLDVKHADAAALVDVLDRTGMRERVFVWTSYGDWLEEFARLAPDVPVKINVRTVDAMIAAVAEHNARIVEVDAEYLNDELIAASHARDVRVMVNYMGDDVAVIERLVHVDFDMINTDNADIWLEYARAAGRHA
jgi:glycerophosphoryl diester phosphodiesterase